MFSDFVFHVTDVCTAMADLETRVSRIEGNRGMVVALEMLMEVEQRVTELENKKAQDFEDRIKECEHLLKVLQDKLETR